MQPNQPTPDQLASFDQTHAQLSANIDTIVGVYHREVAEGYQPDVSTAALAQWLFVENTPEALADHLAVAVRRLHDAQADVDAAYQRGLAEGQADRDQLRRLHEATEAALEQAGQYARDLQDDGVLTEEAREQGIVEGRRQATERFIAECNASARDYRRRYRTGPPPPPGLVDERPRDLRSLHVAVGMELACNLARHRLLADGPWETDEQPEPGCPTCHTILNAKAAACSDPWHADNRPEPATGGVVDSAVRYDLGGKDITDHVQPPGLRRRDDPDELMPHTLGDCPRCGKAITGFHSEPHDEDWSRGYREIITVATRYEPCGCTYIQAVGKPEDGGR